MKKFENLGFKNIKIFYFNCKIYKKFQDFLHEKRITKFLKFTSIF